MAQQTLTLETVQVRSQDGQNRVVLASLAKCGVCKADRWIVFQIEGHRGFHLQCAVCDMSYCASGECLEHKRREALLA